ncbi:uncharacterized protein I206_106066 [Kwoniella pini CBS 10737]|uniref:Uncharacterized protein n=1 Tax=Kwoniella pini CBS 10737 TaxID=1296096 RepID=A0A1B9I178_9TREE|nr:uncharacterized protein I206_04889 [Kwoniella pini CBS 10737]OCF49201.1 hypothetical protein I206_04889 [Kwoniella pini CBS 10737]
MADNQQNDLDDGSDLFQYGGDSWGVDHADDPWTPQYYESTFHTTTVHLAWSRICWEGQDISIYGAKRDNHGMYAVSIDNQDPVFADGFSKQEQMQAVLYASNGLEWNKHQLTIWNTNKFNFTKNHIWLDVDFASFSGSAISCDELPGIAITPSDPSGSVSTSTYPGVPLTSSGANATSTFSRVDTSNIAAFSVTTASSISPSTTITLSSLSSVASSSSVSASATQPQNNGSSAGTSSAGARHVPGVEGQVALLTALGLYLFKLWL